MVKILKKYQVRNRRGKDEISVGLLTSHVVLPSASHPRIFLSCCLNARVFYCGIKSGVGFLWGFCQSLSFCEP